MIEGNDLVTQLRELSAKAAFNSWLAMEVASADKGTVELAIKWQPEMGQYSGLLHAGIQGALIDTACGFAAVTLGQNVVASQFSVRCLRPAIGESFLARAWVVKQGRRQIFAQAELTAMHAGQRTLVAVGDTLLLPVD